MISRFVAKFYRIVGTLATALLAMVGTVACANATTIGAGSSFVATFTVAPNSTDMLWFFDNTALTNTGSPVISVQLFNGSTLLGTYTETVAAALLVSAFESTGSQYTAALFGPPPTRVNFSSINTGGSNDTLVLTVAGGTITFNNSDLVLYDGLSASPNSFAPRADLSNISYTVVSAPEPGGSVLGGLGIAILAGWVRRVRMAQTSRKSVNL
jgi:hypothetical protein